MPRWFKFILGVIALLIVAAGALMIYVTYFMKIGPWDLSNLDNGHFEAELAFMEELNRGPACITRDTVIALAQSREWDVRNEPEFAWCHSPVGLVDWLRVTVEPSLFMSTDDENAAFFGFDNNGCSVDWNYASGEGTTCP